MEEPTELPENNEPSEPKAAKPKKSPRKISMGTKITAKVMTESGFGQRETARELNVPLDTVQRAIKDSTLDRELIEKVKSHLPNKLYLIAFKIADRLMNKPEVMEKMNPYMCTLVMGIMIDKARLMDGQSTENIAVKGTVAEIQTTLKTIAEMRQRLAHAQPSPTDESSQ